MLPLARPRTCILVLFPALRFGSDSLKDHLDVGACEYKESDMWSRCRDVWRCGMSGVMMYNSRLCYSRPRTTLRLPQNAVARTRCFLEISVYPEIKSAVTLLRCVEITPANVVVQHCSRYHSLQKSGCSSSKPVIAAIQSEHLCSPLVFLEQLEQAAHYPLLLQEAYVLGRSHTSLLDEHAHTCRS
jgi:hypothetical protein